ncbi:MAG: molybdopterin molybdotransferase MoeA [Desulfobacterales bacterium]
MKEFFKVMHLREVLALTAAYSPVGTEEVRLSDSFDRILGSEIISDIDIPNFSRSTVDGYSVLASSTFGASESNPAYLNIVGSVGMGEMPSFSIRSQEAAGIPTGGMMPDGSDAVIMVEHTDRLDDTALEVYKSVAPGQHMIGIGEDIQNGSIVLEKGRRIRAQESGFLAALGKNTVTVFRKPVVGILSTGDEIVSIEDTPGPGRIRDINSFTLSALVHKAGGIAKPYGIVRDNYDALFEKSSLALSQCDMVLISGGSSVGTRDFTTSVLSALPDSRILVHGISISPGKPTILAETGKKPVWGLPGHVTSAMVVFQVVVKPFIERISGSAPQPVWKIPAILDRNISSAQGRTDFIRVRLVSGNGVLAADPILGKSGLINTMLRADGLIEIGVNTEGLEKDTPVEVMLI